ncbi:hypothetical protein CRYO30217_01380 [Parvicella tangerina]|uniref:Uncharacterized protein n=2 Tax=Parvicella tangerina TaxID=2829795 RepID=A0A916JLY9_9FLAO|nr:hypothetical protein CRYO30217_01380 [Parvicella tangerina]
MKEYAIKKEIKTKIKKGVDKDELYTFVLTEENQDQFEWEHSKEFKYKGMMYDVVYKTIHEDGSVVLQCVSDEQETELFQHLDNYLASEFTNQHNGKHPLVEFHQFLSHLFCNTDTFSESAMLADSFSISDHLSNFYCNPFLKEADHPPQV